MVSSGMSKIIDFFSLNVQERLAKLQEEVESKKMALSDAERGK